uniref:Uncharacterized protein n=1 Tax=Anguilla anguilla TaxID=7936 RepID=A0A0E9RFB0_ANGAN
MLVISFFCYLQVVFQIHF